MGWFVAGLTWGLTGPFRMRTHAGAGSLMFSEPFDIGKVVGLSAAIDPGGLPMLSVEPGCEQHRLRQLGKGACLAAGAERCALQGPIYGPVDDRIAAPVDIVRHFTAPIPWAAFLQDRSLRWLHLGPHQLRRRS